MSSIRLNAQAIAAGSLALDPPRLDLQETLERLGEQSLLVTRRDILKAAGVATAVATGAVSARTLEPLSDTAVGARSRGAWLRAGGHRAFLSPASFAGSPTLTITSNGTWQAALANARYPGVSVPAGIELLVSGTGIASMLSLRHALGGFEARVPLADWLAGKVQATSSVDLGILTTPLDNDTTLRLAGRAIATLSPDWSMRLEGDSIARLTAMGAEVVADAVTISLAGLAETSLLSRKFARRTTVTLERGERAWSLPAPGGSRLGTLDLAPDTFDSMVVESAETLLGAIHSAVLARSSGGGVAFWAPAHCDDGSALALTNVRYARLAGAQAEFQLVADYADPQWLRLGNVSYLAGNTASAPPFELKGNGHIASALVRPGLAGVALPVSGSDTAVPLLFSQETATRLELGDADARSSLSDKAPALLPGPGQIIIIDPGDIIPIPLKASALFTRADDMLTLGFEFFNFRILPGDSGSVLKRLNAEHPSYISVTFPPQHVLEEAVKDVPSSFPLKAAPWKSYLAGESRLAFKVSNTRADAGIPFNLEGLLDWTGFEHEVVTAAISYTKQSLGTDLKSAMLSEQTGRAGTSASSPPQTSLEVPWGVWMSPSVKEYWKHRKLPKTANSRTELWHTRMRGRPVYINPGFDLLGSGAAAPGEIDADVAAALASDAGVAAAAIAPGPGDDIIINPPIYIGDADPTLRVIWSKHYDARLVSDAPPPNPPTANLFRNSFSTTLDNAPTTTNDFGGIRTRWSITDLAGRFQNEPIKVNNFMLTSMGAWLDSNGKWETEDIKNAGVPVIGEVIQWDHRATMGRDQYVKIVEYGRLFPFGHKAVKITITERRVDAASGLAFLGQKTYIMVKEPTKTYSQENATLKRRFPFKKVTIRPEVTPQIDARRISYRLGKFIGFISSTDAFWVQAVSTGKDFLFDIEAVDWDGDEKNPQKFSMPLIWVRGTIASKDPSDTDTVQNSYSLLLTRCANSLRSIQVPLAGQRVALAKNPGGATAGPNRILPTNWMKFGAEVVANPPALGDQRFWPLMHEANVSLEAVEELTNQTAGTTIRIADIYSLVGFTATNSVGQVFAEIVSAPGVDFPAELAGALATPVPKFSGIGATKGAFGGDLAKFGSGEFKPADFFDALNAKLIGGITLMDVLDAVLDLDSMPVFQKAKDLADTKWIVVSYDWATAVTREVVVFEPKSGCQLKLHAEIRKSVVEVSQPPTFLVRGELGPFDLNLVKGVFDALTLKFEKITFESVNGSAPSVDPQITDVQFKKELQYLAELAKYLGALSGDSGSSALARARKTDGLAKQETVLDAGPLKVDVTASGVKASLTLLLPDITIGVFSLKNMSFYAGLTLPFTGDPVTLDFSFCSPQSPFELLVMGFGGGGYVMMSFDPVGMKSLEVSLEFGAGCAFSIGALASGSVEIKGGLSVRWERVEGGAEMTFTVFIRIQGRLKILGLISVTLTFYLELKYKTFPKPGGGGDGDKLTGTATLTIEIEILFFTIPVELSVTKELAGDDPRFADLMPEQDDWDEYCTAFAPATLGA